jgi:hypothetical protein
MIKAGGVFLLLWSFSASAFRMQPHAGRVAVQELDPHCFKRRLYSGDVLAACARLPVIGSLHHADDRNADDRALREVARCPTQ